LLITTLSLLAGFILLLGGGEYLVRGAGAIALRFGLSHLVVGIVIVGFGTSVPELVASVQAAMAGAPGIAMGNVVGSNIANILLILGAGAIIYPVIVSKHAVYRDGVTMVATAALLLIAVWSGQLSFAGGLLFVILLASYLTYLIYSDRKQNGEAKEDDEDDDDLPVPSKSVWLDLLMVAGGILAVVGGGKLLVDNAIVLAKTFDVSDEVIGLTLVSSRHIASRACDLCHGSNPETLRHRAWQRAGIERLQYSGYCRYHGADQADPGDGSHGSDRHSGDDRRFADPVLPGCRGEAVRQTGRICLPCSLCRIHLSAGGLTDHAAPGCQPAGAMVKPPNSKPGETVQPTNDHFPRLAALCQQSAGTMICGDWPLSS
jgi:hypothetical protein